MVDSTALHDQQSDSLRARFESDGYLYLKKLLSSDHITQARKYLTEQLQQSKAGCFSLEGELLQSAGNIGLLRRQDLAHAPTLLRVLEAQQLVDLTSFLLQESSVKTTSYKWLRGVALGEFTGLHSDRVFLGGGSERLLTIWIPLGHIPVMSGSLLVVSGSHRLRSFANVRDSYGASRVGGDGTRSGWLCDNGAELQGLVHRSSKCSSCTCIDWRTTDFAPGDVVVLNQDVLHMSASNQSNPAELRISCDTRWQPTGDITNSRLGKWEEYESVSQYN